MGNVFDFELNADENATKALAEIEARIKQLNPLLGSTREALRFGGSETLETTGGLSNQLRDMSRYAQDIHTQIVWPHRLNMMIRYQRPGRNNEDLRFFWVWERENAV